MVGEWWFWDTHLTSERVFFLFFFWFFFFFKKEGKREGFNLVLDRQAGFKLGVPFCFKCGRLGFILHRTPCYHD